MKNNEEKSQSEINKVIEFDNTISQGVLRFLGVIALFASMSGFFIIISILVCIKQNESFNFSHGLTIGFLLLIGGIILLFSLPILNHGFNKE